MVGETRGYGGKYEGKEIEGEKARVKVAGKKVVNGRGLYWVERRPLVGSVVAGTQADHAAAACPVRLAIRTYAVAAG